MNVKITIDRDGVIDDKYAWLEGTITFKVTPGEPAGFGYGGSPPDLECIAVDVTAAIYEDDDLAEDPAERKITDWEEVKQAIGPRATESLETEAAEAAADV